MARGEIEVKVIYCRGGDPYAPQLAQAAGMEYGIRYDYTAYGEVYMLDGGLRPRWTRYVKRARILRPSFILTPDYLSPDPISLQLRIRDIAFVPRIGVTPKFTGAIAHIPAGCIICESIPSQYSGWLIPGEELLPDRQYHLLGGDPRLQKREVARIRNAGGTVVSIDGNKIAMKAAYGQVFSARQGQWMKDTGTNEELAQKSAYEVIEYLRRAK
jgi:hypothetical protein